MLPVVGGAVEAAFVEGCGPDVFVGLTMDTKDQKKTKTKQQPMNQKKPQPMDKNEGGNTNEQQPMDDNKQQSTKKNKQAQKHHQAKRAHALPGDGHLRALNKKVQHGKLPCPRRIVRKLRARDDSVPAITLLPSLAYAPFWQQKQRSSRRRLCMSLPAALNRRNKRLQPKLRCQQKARKQEWRRRFATAVVQTFVRFMHRYYSHQMIGAESPVALHSDALSELYARMCFLYILIVLLIPELLVSGL